MNAKRRPGSGRGRKSRRRRGSRDFAGSRSNAGAQATREREYAAGRLEESDAFFEKVLHSSLAGVYVYDLKRGVNIFINRRFTELTGFTLERITSMSGAVFGELYHPDDAERVTQHIQEVARSAEGESLEIEYRFRTAQGGWMWCWSRDTVFARDEGGSVTHMLGTFLDITDRKSVEEAVWESERRNRLLWETMLHGVVHQDAGGTIVAMNPAAERILGKSRAEFLGSSSVREERDTVREDGSLFPGQEHPSMVALWTGKPARGVVMGVFNPQRKEPRWIRIDAVPVFSRGRALPAEVYTVFEDITEHKQAEEALRKSEEQFRTLANSIPNLAWWANNDGYITWYNQRWYEYTGSTPEQMEGWGWQSVHDPAMLPGVLERWRASIATGEPFEMEFPLRGADGQFRWFLTRVQPVRDEAGKVLRWFGTNTDVSEAREAREVLRRSKEELERLVAERTAKLQELVGELEHFSYTITHDMRAPLRAMIGYGEVVHDLCAACGKMEPKEFLRRIMTSAERMDALIRDALNYSRSVRQELPLEDVDTGALLRGMLDSYPELQPSRAHIRIEGRLPMVLGNEAGLTQCLSNLLGNAVKFARPGQTPHIRVRAEEREGRARIWVEDKGIGIAKELLPRIFDMFSRGSRQYEGTGIGLALVRKVVHRMGGNVGVESEEGKGSRFWLELRSGECRR